MREFQAQAVATVSAIAEQLGVLPEAPKRGRRQTFAGLGQQAKLQVAARTVSPPPLERLPLESGKGFARLPAPSPGDIFLDYEGDPFAGEHGLGYLTGFHVREEIGPRTIAATAASGATKVVLTQSSSPEDAPRGMAFLYGPHRFNVATSRAQAVVVVVASPRLFEPECRTPEQLRWANWLCRYREMATIVQV